MKSRNLRFLENNGKKEIRIIKMDIKELKEMIKDLPDDMALELGTTSTYITEKIDITVMPEENKLRFYINEV